MRLSGGEMDCDDETVAVTDQMDLRAKPAPGTSQRMVRRLLHLRRLWPAQLLGAARVFFRPRRRLAGPDDGAIDTPEVVIDLPLVVQFVQQRGDDTAPSAVRPPPVEAPEDRLPGTVTFREVTPWGAGMEDPEDAIDDRSKIVKGMACLAVMSTVRQEGRDPRPLWLGDFIAAHGRTRWRNSPVWKLGLPIIIFLQTIAEQGLVYV